MSSHNIVCRVCLIDSTNLYNIVNTYFEELYEKVTNTKLQKHGQPSCVCCVCLSALRRCRKFVETAQESNNTLDRWCRNQDVVKLTKRPLFSLIKTCSELVEITSEGIQEPAVKQECCTTDETENNGLECNGMVHQIKYENEEIKFEHYEVYDDENDNTQWSDSGTVNTHVFNDDVTDNKQASDENDHTRASDDESDKKQAPDENDYTLVSVNEGENKHASNENDYTLASDDKSNNKQSFDDNDNEWAPNQKDNIKVSSYFEGIHVQVTITDVGNDNTQVPEVEDKTQDMLNVELESNTASITINKNNHALLDQDIPFQPLRSRKRVKSNKGTKNAPAQKKQQITLTNRSLKSDGISEVQIEKETLLETNRKPNVKPRAAGKSFVCDKCDYKSCNKSDLKVHLSSHTGEKPFECDKCNFKSRQKGHLTRHLVIHSSEKPFACDKCIFKTNRKDTLKQHLISNSCEKSNTFCEYLPQSDKNKFSCDKCDFSSSRHFLLKQHLLVHTDEKPLACDKCSYKTTRKEFLKRHAMGHTGEKPFACDICKYKSSRQDLLKLHLMKHIGMKSFGCNFCDCKYTTKYALKLHMRKNHAGNY